MATNQATSVAGSAGSRAHRQGRHTRWIKWIALPLAGGFAGMVALLMALRALPLPDQSLVNPTRIDSADGQHLAEWTIKGTHPENIPLAKIPRSLQDATIAVEDRKFYTHHAFSPLSIARASWVDISHGRVLQGGSTITQQLAKNLYLSQDRTVTRKLREALYAIQLELHETKKTILEQYFNVVYYGHGAYGVGAAAHVYFNKPVADLNLAESAMLAGLPKGPSLYSPFTHYHLAKQRQREVLDRMVQSGYLTRQAADAAYGTVLHFSTTQPPTIRAPYFTISAVREAEQRFHLTSDDMYRGDLAISTTLDPVLQAAAERAVASTLPVKSGIQAALVAIDPVTGAVKAMVGGRNYQTSPYNRVFAERQPGSTFKAILYTAALEHGWVPSIQVNSELTTFLYDRAKLYTVHDYGDLYAHRPLTLREALARSDNVYAVTTNLNIGPKEVIATARTLGISSPLSPYPSLALGVFPTSPLQMATAYATLANGGFRVDPYSVSEVRDARKGKVYQTSPQRIKAVSPQVAFQMTDLLTSVLKPNGTGYGIRQYLHGAASAKTGTTDTDAWMVGYTPKLVCAVWVGYDNNRLLTKSESHLAGPIWAKFMGTAQQRLPATWFKPPEGLVKAVIDPVSGKLATNTCGTTETDYYLKGTEPTEHCPLHTPLPPQRHQVPWYKQWLRRWL